MDKDQEAEQKIYEILKMLYASISEFLDERVAPAAQSYTNHFLSILDDVVRDGTREQLESEGTRFVKALDALEAKLKAEYLQPSQMQILFESKSIGQELHQKLEAAIQNRVNDVAAPAFDRITEIVDSGRFD